MRSHTLSFVSRSLPHVAAAIATCLFLCTPGDVLAQSRSSLGEGSPGPERRFRVTVSAGPSVTEEEHLVRAAFSYGVGLELPLASSAPVSSVYAEVRLHRMLGSAHGAEYAPLALGVRFQAAGE